MKKTATHVSAAKKRGLLLIIALILIAAPQSQAVAQTVASGTPVELTLELNALGEAQVSGPIKPMSVQDTLLAVCVSRGYGEDCARTLLGMAWKESRFVGNVRGDFYSGVPHAVGWFQIHYKLHRVTVECAEDLTCSANWTIDYLESNGYPKYVKYAVQCHNSCGNPNRYAENALWHGQRLWNADEKLVAIAK